MHPPRIIPAARISRAVPAPAPGRFFAGLAAAAAVLALVLASALPARADKRSDDLAKALLGIIVLGAIVNELNDNDRKPAPAPVHKKKHKADRPRIPAVCAIQIDGQRRSVTVYPESCLRDEGVRAKLPRHCSHEARIYGKWDRIYGVDCLREAGFEVREDRGR
ncbi:hypothetical protein LHP98_14800 [Rhodobacter sp. Har01]|uniref:hypothetical protein n=1 Tax=Rhodobacter sp. Har01 TaxID=2883999 RepID=UPI001D08C6E6|nr:hypothetical protein [Rhodobacter sp. Har01]MCB6179389.1 hypothetical protein [Rhodobacter sp. Har01]